MPGGETGGKTPATMTVGGHWSAQFHRRPLNGGHSMESWTGGKSAAYLTNTECTPESQNTWGGSTRKWNYTSYRLRLMYYSLRTCRQHVLSLNYNSNSDIKTLGYNVKINDRVCYYYPCIVEIISTLIYVPFDHRRWNWYPRNAQWHSLDIK